jgi:probable biosynthetic protein (TIGR04098 family)
MNVVATPSLLRRICVDLSMCGQNALFAARVGDWTWETVARQCGLDVPNARNQAGDRTYLAFSYFHIQASPLIHPLGLAVGEHIDLLSQAYGCGHESVVVLHRVCRASDATDDGSGFLSPAELHGHPRPDCLYVENLNRWVVRGRDGGNTGLTSSAPAAFDHGLLPALHARGSPRALPSAARRAGSLARLSQPRLYPVAPERVATYRIDPSRDLNGVGLVYFAAYFSFIDSALLGYWRQMGRSDRSFLGRRIIDHKLCYYANANPDATLSITMRLYTDPGRPHEEVADITVRDHAVGHLLAMSAIRTATS